MNWLKLKMRLRRWLGLEKSLSGLEDTIYTEHLRVQKELIALHERLSNVEEYVKSKKRSV